MFLHGTSFLRKEGEKMGSGTQILPVLNRIDHLLFCLSQANNEMDSNIKSSKDRNGHVGHIPVMIPLMRASHPCSPQLIEKLGRCGVNSNSNPVCSGLLHRHKRIFMTDQRWRDKNA